MGGGWVCVCVGVCGWVGGWIGGWASQGTFLVSIISKTEINIYF